MKDFGQYDSPRAEGFTLTELLVAIAIFITLLGGVGALFVGAVRTTRQGFQNQEAYETARAALSIIESDLTRAFASRDHGQYYSFYGTPIGFTFVGLAAPRNDRPTGNLARVTYVVYRDPEVLEALPAPDGQPETGTDRYVYRLLRYIEPGVGTLDEFPINWFEPIQTDVGTTYTLANYLDTYCDNCLSANGSIGPGSFVNLDPEREKEVNAAKREFWVRALSGGDGIVPNAWDPTNGVLDLSRGASGYPNPLDFVVGENLLFNPPVDSQDPGLILTERQSACFSPGLQPHDPECRPGVEFDRYVNLYFFAYVGIEQADVTTSSFSGPVADVEMQAKYRAFWNDTRNGDIRNSNDQPHVAPIGSHTKPRLPQQVVSSFTLFFESPYAGAPDFRRRFDQRIDLPTGYRRFPKN